MGDWRNVNNWKVWRPCLRAEKPTEHKDINYILISELGTVSKRIRKETGGIGDQWKDQNHPRHSILRFVRIPGDLLLPSLQWKDIS